MSSGRRSSDVAGSHRLRSAARESQIWHRGAACGEAAGARSTTEVLAQAGNGEVNLPVSG
jgi:hypothetical protein